ncbi:MAG TPA: hypothetical protein VEA16_00170 [Vicinamibacterales bacterium]|nr:hypothetical protein [Vicinamibacterales bacterium]
MKTLLALVFITCASSSFAQSSGPRPLEDDLLDRLIGRWVATGTTHKLQMPQTVQVDWVLNHQFVRIDQKSTGNRPGWNIPYEASHFIGYDRMEKRYVLFALDVHGAAGPRVAYGSRQGNEIRFEAAAGQQTVGMRLTWQPESETWRTVWGSQPAGGEFQTVTDLVMSRAK